MRSAGVSKSQDDFFFPQASPSSCAQSVAEKPATKASKMTDREMRRSAILMVLSPSPLSLFGKGSNLAADGEQRMVPQNWLGKCRRGGAAPLVVQGAAPARRWRLRSPYVRPQDQPVCKTRPDLAVMGTPLV